MKRFKIKKDSLIAVFVLIALSVLLNTISRRTNLPFSSSFQFPFIRVFASVILGLSTLILSEYIYSFFFKTSVSNGLNVKRISTFFITCLLAFSTMYLTVSIILHLTQNGTFNWYRIFVFFLINISVFTIGFMILYGIRILSTKSIHVKKNQLKIISGSRTFYIEIDRIAYFHFSDNVVYAMQFDSKRLVTHFTLNYLEDKLNDNFFRVNRQTLISRQSVKQIIPDKNRKLLIEVQPQFSENKFLKVSRYKATSTKNWLDKA